MSANITHADLMNMRTNFVGGCMGSLLYGINICVYIAAIYFLVKQKMLNEKLQWTMFIFATLLFAGATTMTGAGIKMSQIILIDSQVNSNDPSGAAQSFSREVLLNRLNLFLNGVYITTNFIADLLILYRLYFVWGRNIWVVAIPSLIFLASTVCSIIFEYQSTDQTAVVIPFVLPYLSLSVALTIIVTALITFRLMAGARIIGAIHRSPYVSIVAMIIESAALYTIVGIFFIAFVVSGNPGQNVLNPMLGQAMCIAPNLIIARVAAGASFSDDTFTHHGATPIHIASNLRYATHELEAGMKYKGSPPERSVVELQASSLTMDEVVLSDTVV